VTCGSSAEGAVDKGADEKHKDNQLLPSAFISGYPR
jgi:hypothetical protein